MTPVWTQIFSRDRVRSGLWFSPGSVLVQSRFSPGSVGDMLRLLVVLLLCAVAQSRVFERCEWARLLKSRGMDQYKSISLADSFSLGVCLTRWESSYNTTAINHNHDNSTDYGVFQINSKWWCKDGGVSKDNGCRIQCSELLTDDPTVAINCAKTVATQQGAKAWVAWKAHCEGKDLSPYIEDCGLDLPTFPLL